MPWAWRKTARKENIMKSYIIKYQGKKVFSRGEDARDAFDRYCERIQKFNSHFALPWEAKLELIDADTGGDEIESQTQVKKQ